MPAAVLNTTWFALIGLLWAGFFFLEGFDFGVAILTPFLIADETDRRLCLNAVGPVWDGNEVWLLVAGGATFAAFPVWYAHLFSGFYLALFLILLALIARGISFEYRDKRDSAGWRAIWDWANLLGSLIPAIVLGVAFTNLAHGVPLGPGGVYTGGLLGLLHPIAIMGGLASLALFCLHGALFLALKTSGGLARRARRSAGGLAVAAALLLAGTLAWLSADSRPFVPWSLPAGVPLGMAVLAVVAAAAAGVLAVMKREGAAFAATGLAILAAAGAVFSRMYPAVLPSSTVARNTLTIGAASAGHSTLVVMTWVAAIFTPIVLGYEAWSYWVFRQRLIRPPQRPPAAPPAPGLAPARR
ncbi:MAG: cytochrome d ubiquinol oxidase subunit II [Gemmatimonadota bacterium]